MLYFVSTSFGNLSSKEPRRNLFNVQDHVTWIILQKQNKWNVIVCDPKGSVISLSLSSRSVFKNWAA